MLIVHDTTPGTISLVLDTVWLSTTPGTISLVLDTVWLSTTTGTISLVRVGYSLVVHDTRNH